MKALAISLVFALSSSLASAESHPPSPAGAAPPQATVGQSSHDQGTTPDDTKPGASGQNQNYNDVDSSSSDVVTSGGAGANSNRGNNH